MHHSFLHRKLATLPPNESPLPPEMELIFILVWKFSLANEIFQMQTSEEFLIFLQSLNCYMKPTKAKHKSSKNRSALHRGCTSVTAALQQGAAGRAVHLNGMFFKNHDV